ncbi:MAG: alpha-amylase [Coriobacteriales bacterium]|nr:alpha-amylase [Coriobacteriales bacterium]
MSELGTQLNGTMLQGFSWNLPPDGQHWRRLAQLAPRLAEENFTSIWMPPAYKGASGIRDVGYGVYDLWDLGEFDQRGSVATKYGTREEYQTAIRALQDAGLNVLADVVLNHRLGADATQRVMATEVARDNRNYALHSPRPISAYTRYDFLGRGDAYDDFKWDYHCFKAVDYDVSHKRDGIFLLEGKHWDEDVDHENGNFDYLMGADVDLDDERVYNQLVKWGTWYLRETGVNGVRLDAIKHMSRRFYLRWLQDMRNALGRELFCVGEYWLGDTGTLLHYLGSEKAMSLFDVPLHFKFFHASHDGYRIDFQHILAGTLVEADPVHAVTFVDNHDTQPNQALESTVEAWFKPVAYSLILLREAGYPCVFFADLYGLPNDRIRAVAELPLLLEIRRRFSFGRQIDWFDEPDLVAWVRDGDDQHNMSGCVVVLSSRDGMDEPVQKSLDLGRHHAGEEWTCVLGEDHGPVRVNDDGVATFVVGKAMLSVFLRTDAALSLDNIPINI